MKVEVKEPEPWQRVLEIDAPLDLLKEESVQLYKRYREEIALPGFRKGRVPQELIRAKYGQAIEREALERTIPRIYEEALKKTAEKPITKAIVEDVKYKPDEGVSFRATFEVIPPLELRGYSGIFLTKRARKVTKKRVGKELSSLMELHKELVTVDREARRGDFLVVDHTCRTRDGELLDGISGSNCSLSLNGQGMTSGLLGTKAGETREVPYTHSEDDSNQSLAGREVLYRFQVREVKETRLPKLDNDLAKDLGFKDLRELKSKLAEELKARDDTTVREELELQLIEKLISSNSFDPPPSLVESYLAEMLEEARRGCPPEEPLDESRLREDGRPHAIYRARRAILLDRIAELGEIGVSDEELEEKVAEIAKSSRLDPSSLREHLEKRGKLWGIRIGLRREKTIGWLLARAEIRTQRKRGE